MNYLRDLQRNPKAKPASYWKNTSDNSIIRSFIDYRGTKISQKLETLLSGGYILQKIEEDLTYDYLHSSEENLWSILYLTGYLTQVREDDLPAPLPKDTSALIIPNAEVREIFKTTIQKWFDESAQTWNLTTLFDAMWSGDAETLTAEINKLLYKTISYHDYKEDFYHAFLTGILAGSGCAVESNREHGEGRSDIVVFHPDRPQVVLFEAKYSKKLDGLEESCAAALQQIEDRQYAKEFEEDYDSILCYGIAFIKSAAWSKQNNLVLYFASSTEQSEYSLCSAFLFTAPTPKRSRTLPSAGSPLETAGWRKTAASKTLGSREMAVPAPLPASRPCRSTATEIPPQNT